MMLKNLFLPYRAVDMGIYLSGGDALMPKHLLHHTQVGAMLQKVCGKRMAEGMRRYLLAYPCSKSLLLYHRKHGNPAERLPEPVQEQDIGRYAISWLRTHLEVLQHGFHSHIT